MCSMSLKSSDQGASNRTAPAALKLRSKPTTTILEVVVFVTVVRPAFVVSLVVAVVSSCLVSLLMSSSLDFGFDFAELFLVVGIQRVPVRERCVFVQSQKEILSGLHLFTFLVRSLSRGNRREGVAIDRVRRTFQAGHWIRLRLRALTAVSHSHLQLLPLQRAGARTEALVDQ